MPTDPARRIHFDYIAHPTGHVTIRFSEPIQSLTFTIREAGEHVEKMIEGIKTAAILQKRTKDRLN
jgi:hypothetical protein